MKATAHGGSSGAEVWLVLVVPLLLILLAAWVAPAAAPQPVEVIVLPGASSAEGIAAGRGTTFYVGDLLQGDNFPRGMATSNAQPGRWRSAARWPTPAASST
jgi:hypothetical protein